MPSPFPGMDPYLEAPEQFDDFHHTAISYLREALNAILPPPYYTSSTNRVVIDTQSRTPDLTVVRGDGPRRPRRGGVALLECTEPVVLRAAEVEDEDDTPEAYLEVRTRIGGRETLITSVEVLSPSNKRTGERKRAAYIAKQALVFGSQVNLVEIDLLRGGIHTTAVDLSRLANLPPFAYHVCVHRFDKYGDFEVYPVALTSRLPVIKVPLLPGDDDVLVDIQAVVDRVYDTGNYHFRIDYVADPPPPAMTPEQLAWLRERVTASDAAEQA